MILPWGGVPASCLRSCLCQPWSCPPELCLNITTAEYPSLRKREHARDVAQLIECLLSMKGALGPTQTMHRAMLHVFISLYWIRGGKNKNFTVITTNITNLRSSYTSKEHIWKQSKIWLWWLGGWDGGIMSTASGIQGQPSQERELPKCLSVIWIPRKFLIGKISLRFVSQGWLGRTRPQDTLRHALALFCCMSSQGRNLPILVHRPGPVLTVWDLFGATPYLSEAEFTRIFLLLSGIFLHFSFLSWVNFAISQHWDVI